MSEININNPRKGPRGSEGQTAKYLRSKRVKIDKQQDLTRYCSITIGPLPEEQYNAMASVNYSVVASPELIIFASGTNVVSPCVAEKFAF